jgi:hypothetical protein
MLGLAYFEPPSCLLDTLKLVPQGQSSCTLRRQTTVRIHTTLRYADITYLSWGNNVRLKIENTSKNGIQQSLDAQGYLSVFDDIFPAVGEKTTNLLQLFLFDLCSHTLSKSIFASSYVDILMLPIQLQQFYDRIGRLTSRVAITDCKPSYKIIVSPSSLWTFAAAAGFIMFSCMGMIIAHGWRSTVNCSSFPDIDLIARSSNSHNLRELFSDMDRTSWITGQFGWGEYEIEVHQARGLPAVTFASHLREMLRKLVNKGSLFGQRNMRRLRLKRAIAGVKRLRFQAIWKSRARNARESAEVREDSNGIVDSLELNDRIIDSDEAQIV